MKHINFFPYGLVLFGPLFFWFGFQDFLVIRAFEQNSVPVQATVVALEENATESGPVFRSVFEIQIADGSYVRYRGDYWSDPPLHNEGDVVPGHYDESTGEIASDRLIASKRFHALGGVAIGVGMLFGGGYWIVQMRRRRRIGTI